MTVARDVDMSKDPDIAALGERYDVASATPVAQVAEGLTLLAAVA